MPYGVSLDEFRNGIHRQINEVAASGRMGKTVTPDRMKRFAGRPIGDGRIRARSGDGRVVDKSGNPVVINFNVGATELPTTGTEKGAKTV